MELLDDAIDYFATKWPGLVSETLPELREISDVKQTLSALSGLNARAVLYCMYLLAVYMNKGLEELEPKTGLA